MYTHIRFMSFGQLPSKTGGDFFGPFIFSFLGSSFFSSGWARGSRTGKCHPDRGQESVYSHRDRGGSWSRNSELSPRLASPVVLASQKGSTFFGMFLLFL